MHIVLGLSTLAAQAFVSGLWEGLAMVMVAAASLRLLSRLGARLDSSMRYVVWALVFALLVAVPLLHGSGNAAPTVSAAVSSLPGHLAATHRIRIDQRWGLAIAAVWVLLLGLRATRLSVQAVRLFRIHAASKPVVVSEATTALLRSGRSKVVLCTSVDVEAPSVIGFLSPRLLIPESMFATLADHELRQVVMHECEHLRRGDDWVNLLQKVALTLFPLHPALLWADRRLSLERELACDAAVVASLASPFDYAYCLARLAEHRLLGRGVGLTLSAWGRRPELAYRVSSLLKPMQTASPLRTRFAIAGLSLGLLAAGAAMVRTSLIVTLNAPQHAFSKAATLRREVSTGGMQIQSAAYYPSKRPKAKLLETTLKVSHVVRPHANRALTSKPAVKQVTGALSVPRPMMQTIDANSEDRRQPQLLLTKGAPQPFTIRSSHIDDPNPPQLTYAVELELSPSYAAVPFGDGWILVQL